MMGRRGLWKILCRPCLPMPGRPGLHGFVLSLTTTRLSWGLEAVREEGEGVFKNPSLPHPSWPRQLQATSPLSRQLTVAPPPNQQTLFRAYLAQDLVHLGQAGGGGRGKIDYFGVNFWVLPCIPTSDGGIKAPYSWWRIESHEELNFTIHPIQCCLSFKAHHKGLVAGVKLMCLCSSFLLYLYVCL